MSGAEGKVPTWVFLSGIGWTVPQATLAAFLPCGGQNGLLSGNQKLSTASAGVPQGKRSLPFPLLTTHWSLKLGALSLGTGQEVE